jgi:hypothetical protein
MVATLTQKIDETLDQLDNLDSLCGLFFTDRKFTIYKSISVALRLLLTGSSGHVGLVQDVLPTGGLLPLRKVPAASTPPDMLVLPARVFLEKDGASTQLGNGTLTVKDLNVFGGAVGAMKIEEMFNSAAPSMSLVAWLEQPFLRPNWTLRKFIGTVTNKDGGAHHDPNDALLSMQKWGHFHWHLTAGMARSILPQLRTQLLTTYPKHVRPIR